MVVRYYVRDGTLVSTMYLLRQPEDKLFGVYMYVCMYKIEKTNTDISYLASVVIG